MSLSLRAKIIILPIILSAVGLSIIGYLATKEVSKRVMAQEREEALLTVSLFDADVETLDNVMDPNRIKSLINKLARERPSILSFSFNGPVYDKAKIAGYRVLASSEPALIWTDITSDINELVRADKVITSNTMVDGKPAIEITAPLHINGEPLAGVNIVTMIRPGVSSKTAKELALWITRVIDSSVNSIEVLKYPARLQNMIDTLVAEHPEIARVTFGGPVFQRPPVIEYRTVAGTDSGIAGTLSPPETVSPIIDNRTVEAIDAKGNLRIIAPVHVDRKAVASVDLLFSLDHVRAETARITRFNALATLVTIILMALILHFLLNKMVIKPVSELTDSAKSLADGDLGQEVRVSSKDEVGVLANAFNSMASRIRELVRALELQVIELKQAQGALQNQNIELIETKVALQEAMKNLHTIKITEGVYWLQVPEEDLYVLCGCPADVVKLMMKKGVIAVAKKDDRIFETGPNAILLSDVSIQNGYFSNLAEYPVLQMLYRQGMLLPDHPGNTGIKPLLIGTDEQVNAQMEYIYRGNYGLTSIKDITKAGIPEALAGEMMEMKKKFAFGEIKPTEELLDTLIVDSKPVEIRNGVFVQRRGFNRYEFTYKGKSAVIDLDLKANETYESPYPLGSHQIARENFAVIHSGEGDGWDVNRPSMASILMYKGKIFLIDAGPNILHSLRALGIDVGEIEGIFHTHAHDDHFAGLPTLMQSDHRIKYYSTPLVRTSVARKLAGLMSIDEGEFIQYFDVHDLQFDTWNDLNGLEVKPMFSPHPVETNIFLFRAMGAEGYKTYAHWADTVSLEVLDNMVRRDKAADGISREMFESVKQVYLTPADIKKVDIGGGLIHGRASDFRDDISDEIILAHTALKLNEEQKEIGSERSFGTVDVFIPADQDYLMKQAEQLLTSYFPGIPPEQFSPLLSAPVVSFNPGTTIQRKGSKTPYVYFVLTGTVEFTSSEFMIQNHLSKGCFIGDVALLKNIPSSGAWRALSYVQALRFTASLYRTFLEKFGLEQIKNILDNIDFLQKTFLFGEGISYPVQNSIAQNMAIKTYPANERFADIKTRRLCLLKKGELLIKNPHEEIEVVETLKTGDFCCEETLFHGAHEKFVIETTTASEVYVIENYPLLDIPVVHWKLLEVFSKRKKFMANLDEHLELFFRKSSGV